jgi:hypothetical protein
MDLAEQPTGLDQEGLYLGDLHLFLLVGAMATCGNGQVATLSMASNADEYIRADEYICYSTFC